MRPCILTAAFALTLVACGSRMEQIESAGAKLKDCVNQCSLSISPSNKNTNQSATSVGTSIIVDQQPAKQAAGHIQTIWNSRLNFW